MNLKNPTSIYSSLSPQSESNSISSLHSSNQPVAKSSNLKHEPPVSSHNKPLPARVQWIKQDLNAPLNTRFARAVKHIELERINTREKIQVSSFVFFSHSILLYFFNFRRNSIYQIYLPSFSSHHILVFFHQ